MIPGVTGSLLSQEALQRVIPVALRGALGEAERRPAAQAFRAWQHGARQRLGPTSTARGVFDAAALPITSLLGYEVVPVRSAPGTFSALLRVSGRPVAALLVTPWGYDLAAAWRDAVRQGIAFDLRWCLCVSGSALRIADAERTYARRFLEFDLQTLADHEASFEVLWGLLRADAIATARQGESSILERALVLSNQHGLDVRDSLRTGVVDALAIVAGALAAASGQSGRANQPSGTAIAGESLTIIFRILFLLFAEARGLVPHWHPVYRDSYTIESLRTEIETRRRFTGVWEAVQAISRLAHRGCHAGALQVPPFNGRLFSPAHAPLADRLPLRDEAVTDAIVALTSRPGKEGREPVAYADLGVEQLGGVYEHLLDFDLPAIVQRDRRAARRHVTSEARKATGSFYTPRALTDYLVRRTLGPLTSEATPERILRLRVLDPAMGSGAFLVAACRYLATAYELALERSGDALPGEISDADRAEFRRTVAQRCLFGVDLNPMAVHLARLSLWLATLAADRPLTFLDHRLRSGDSLLGSSASDVLRQPPPGRQRGRPAPLPLLEDEVLDAALVSAISVREALAANPGDTLEQVRQKERALERLDASESSIARWRRVADLWCSGWFHDRAGRAEIRTAFHDLADALVHGRSLLPEATRAQLLQRADVAARERRFFHWPLEFPEVFHGPDGHAAADAGFDAVLGNPPWEMLRGDRGAPEERQRTRTVAQQTCDFARSAGIYRLQGDGHVNLYHLFLERSLSLLRDDGRLGLVIPSGLATDRGCARLRRALLDRTEIDTFCGFENRDRLFPVHRSIKFLLLAATKGGSTAEIPARLGLRRADVLDGLADTGCDDRAVPLTRTFIQRFSGDDLSIPDIRTSRDLAITSAIACSIPALGHPDGWHLTFGRELNATEDRRHFVKDGTGLPVIDGKHIQPFAVDVGASTSRIPRRTAERLSGASLALRHARLGYRDVASPGNRLTLIAAIVPAGVLTTHTVFCSRGALEESDLLFLCGMLNSFTANYLVRLQAGTHVTAALMARLQVPCPARTDSSRNAVVDAARALTAAPADQTAHTALQAHAARLYRLDAMAIEHILSTFPLVDQRDRDAVRATFYGIVP